MKSLIRWIALVVLSWLVLILVSQSGLTVENGKYGGHLKKCDSNGNG